MKRFFPSFLCLAASLMPVFAQADAASQKPSEAIPFASLGAEVQKNYTGQGLGIEKTPEGARLKVVFQQLEGLVSRQGLWLESTGQEQGRFQVRASLVGRVGQPGGSVLPSTGDVVVGEDSVAFVRPGLVEEYRVGADGVRQDFVVMSPVPGQAGDLRVTLQVEGAQVQPAGYGVKMTLADSGREIAYSKLKVTDAQGRQLAAKFAGIEGSRLEIQVEDAEAVYPVRIDPTFSDADWLSMNGPQGANLNVYASATDSAGNLYIGGAFTKVGELTANRVAKWDGAVWSALGNGVSGDVRALATSGTTLYVGGSFTTAHNSGGNVAVSAIARWDGASWSALGTGVDSQVHAIAVSGANVYVSGNFANAGGAPANRVARWDGGAWHALGSGVGTSGSGFAETVRALAVSGSAVFAGGTFTTAGGAPASNVAWWNGSSWSAMAEGVDSHVRALAVIGTSVFVGGDFGFSGATAVNRLARWTGSAWVPMGSGGGMNGPVNSLVVVGNDLYVGGGFSTVNGTPSMRLARWSAVNQLFTAYPTGPNDGVNAVAVSGNNVYISGNFSTVDGNSVVRTARWDGQAWHALAPGINGLVRAVAVGANSVFVGGTFTTAGGVAANNIARWDGTAWHALGSGLNGHVNALYALGNTVYVGGEFTTAGGNPALNVAWWAGSSWSNLGQGLNSAVYALTWFQNKLYAGGVFTLSGIDSMAHLARYEFGMGSWVALPGAPNSTVLCLTATQTHLYAGGYFTQAGGAQANRVVSWDGNAWASLGTGLNDGVHAVAVSESDVYVSGEFTSAGGVAANHIAHWNGSTWRPLGSGTSSSITSLAVAGPYLYAGGNFVMGGSVGAVSIAKWNGYVWRPLASGINNVVLALAASGDGRHLYAGGDFTRAGDKDAGRIAHAVLPLEPEINVRGNFVDIVSGDTTPDTADETDFDTAIVGATEQVRTYTIWNFSNVPLVVSGVTITGTHASDFTVLNQPASLLEPSSSSSFTVSFTPTATGLRTAVVNVWNDDANEDPFNFVIQGQAVVPDISLSGNGTEIYNGSNLPIPENNTYFGATIRGIPLERHFMIHNSGSGELFNYQVQITGPNAADFSLAWQPAFNVYPGSASTFILRFNPTGSGFRNATIRVINSDPDESPYTFDIRGRCYDYTPVSQAQTITFVPPAKAFLGQGEIPLLATSSSGLPVTLTVLSGPANLHNNTLTFTGGVGPVKIRATQDGDYLFKPAKPVDRIITIQEDPVTLTLANLTQTYTGTPRPVLALGAPGAVITYNNDPLAPAPTQAGKYPVKAVAGGVTRTGTLIINKAPLVVIPDFQRKLVSQPNPVLTLSYQGLLGTDTEETAMSVEPVGKTTAKGTSPAGGYPITPAGGVSANYSFIYVKGTLLVEGFAGQYEALVTNGFGDATAKLEMTIAASNNTFSGKITSAVDAKAVPVTGGLTTAFASESASGTGSGKSGSTTYQLTVNVPLEGDLTASVTRNGAPLGSAADGKKLLVLVKPATLSYTGAYTLRLAPATGGPEGSGYATAKVNANGSLAIAGKLADGTTLTATLASDREAGYRLFALPYKVRSNSYLGGKFNLVTHPDLSGLRQVSQASNTQLDWAKTGNVKDTSYRAGFGVDELGPLQTQLTMDPWLPPVAAKGSTPAVTLSQRLGLTGGSLGVVHGTIDSSSAVNLPTSVSLGSNNAVTVQLPVTSPVNATNWKVTLVPATGAFTGSFTVSDTVAGKPVPRPVKFSGVLRQPSSADAGGAVGAGHFLVPALPGAASNELLSGEIRFVRP